MMWCLMSIVQNSTLELSPFCVCACFVHGFDVVQLVAFLVRMGECAARSSGVII